MEILYTYRSAKLFPRMDYRDTLSLDPGEADLVVTSPPYDDARTYGNNVSWTFSDYQALGDAIYLALKPGGHALVVLDSPVREWRKGFGTERGFTPWKVMLDWAERVGFRVPDRLAYGRQGVPGAYLGRFRNDWEPLLWFQKPGAKGYFDKWAIAEDSKYPQKKTQASNRRVDGTLSTRIRSGRAVEENKTHRSTFWSYGNIGKGHEPKEAEETDHPARFCERFSEDVVKCFCPPGGLVIDPFLGSGTSAVAAVRHGRNFIGGDLFNNDEGKSWAEVSYQRLAKTFGPE
jgi:DNA modification methylase